MIEIAGREKLVIEPYGEMVEHALSKQLSHLTNHDAFSQQENEEEEVEELEEETVTDANALLDKVFALEENSPTPA